MIERRQIPRWEIGKEVTLRMGSSSVACYVHDMNCKGMKISLPVRLPEDPVVRMSVDLTGTFQLDVEAHVPWQRQENDRYVYGLCFSRIKDSDKEQIYQYLSGNFPQQWKKMWWAGTTEPDVDN